MKALRRACLTAGLAASAFASGSAAAMQPALTTVDLSQPAGVASFQATWRYHDVRILPTQFPAADSVGQPYGDSADTWDIEPHAGAADFDDSEWSPIAPESLSVRRGHGRLSFNWYRIRLVVPEQIDHIPTTGKSVWLQIRIDDYAEIWVDGEIAHPFDAHGGQVIAGWNAINRVRLTPQAKPGQSIQIAIFGINGPISKTPTNYIYFREAKLEFLPGETAPVAVEPQEVNIEVLRADAAIDQIVPRNPKLFKLAEGFQFTEGPVWSRREGHLLFSDPNANRIYRYREPGAGLVGELSVFRELSGYDGADLAEYGQPGSNGLSFDREGRLVSDEHGRHRVSRTETSGRIVTLADRYEGKRLNSPNDLVVKSDDSVYFTDPPFGLPKFFDDPRKELAWSGVYRIKDGRVRLLTTEFKGPNGIAFSPDERHLYVGNWDPAKRVVMRYPVKKDGSLDKGEVFVDLTERISGDEALDGIKVDVAGHVYVSAPGGIWIFDASGKHLGTITAPHPVHNFAWGGEDGKSLYLCARSTLYRIPLLIEGVRP